MTEQNEETNGKTSGERPGLSVTLLLSAIVAALGGFLFGFDTAVISGAEATLQRIYDLGGFWHGFTVSAALIGTILGAITAGKPADLWGRRAVLLGLAVLYLVSALGSALAWSWLSFVAFRFIGGLAVGGASVVAPMYIAELSPAGLRGRLVAVTQLNIVVGILAAFFSNYLIVRLDLGQIEWRWMFGVEALPSAAFLLLLLFVPRSPRWLVARELLGEARAVLGRVGADTGDVDTEIETIQRSLRSEQQSLREPFFQRKYGKPILLAVAIALFNQLSGINAVLYYAPRIFEMAGAGEGAAFFQSVAVGGMNLLFTIAGMAMVDRFGRRKLMVIGSIGYIASLAVTAGAFAYYGEQFTPAGGLVVLIALLVFIASHAIGQGTVIWVFISEIFPNRVRARGQALGSFTHWVMNAGISWTFPIIIVHLAGWHAFAFYCGMMVLQLAWVLTVMPETKGVPLEVIQRELGIEDLGSGNTEPATESH